MKLKDLLKGLKIEKTLGSVDVDIKSIENDSKTVSKGSLFVALTGKDFDGHKFVREAEIYGAVAVIVERETETSLTQIVVKDTREALSIISGNFYLNPARKMKIVGVTGTNGKTTTASLIRSVLDYAGIPCGLIGTLGAYYGKTHVETNLTTPDPKDLHKILFDMYNAGIKVVVMEVSAHAIDLKKVQGIPFEIGVFTNLSQDHLDYFLDMETYKNAKLKFFDKRCKYIVSNSDDEVGREIIKNNVGVISYGINNPADVFAMDVKTNAKNTEFILNLFDAVYEFRTGLIGVHNVENLLATCTVSALLGVKTDLIVEKLSKAVAVSGRLEKIENKNYDIYVDYAHTPDGLKKVLQTLKREIKGRLICVFGCGGNRDEQKREIMGKISGEYADFTVITSDNPRFEDPMMIIKDVEKGVLSKTNNFVVVEDRREGIKYALNYAKSGDVVLIAGKGAEKYQEILGIKHPYNDKDTVNEILRIKK